MFYCTFYNAVLVSALVRQRHVTRFRLTRLLSRPKIPPDSATGMQEHCSKFLLVTVETDRGNRDGDGREIAQRIPNRCTDGTDSYRMLFPVEGNAFNAHALQFLEQLLA